MPEKRHVPNIRPAARQWRAVCSCGWVAPYPDNHKQAVQESQRHASAKNLIQTMMGAQGYEPLS